MHYGSSEEKDKGEGQSQSQEEAGPQDRGGEEVDCEEDWNGSSQDRQKENCAKEITLKGAGRVPAPFLFRPKFLIQNNILDDITQRPLKRVVWPRAPKPSAFRFLFSLFRSLVSIDDFALCIDWRCASH
jgi:hypothetical protein